MLGLLLVAVILLEKQLVRKRELREWSFAYCPVIGMLLGKLQDSQMVLSAFQENQTTGAWVVLTYSSPKTVWFGLRPPGAGLTSITASIYTKASASNDATPHSGDFSMQAMQLVNAFFFPGEAEAAQLAAACQKRK